MGSKGREGGGSSVEPGRPGFAPVERGEARGGGTARPRRSREGGGERQGGVEQGVGRGRGWFEVGRKVLPPKGQKMLSNSAGVSVEGLKSSGRDIQVPSEEELDLSQEDANMGSLKGGKIVEEQRVREERVDRLAEDGLEEVESGGAPPKKMFTRTFPSEAKRT